MDDFDRDVEKFPLKDEIISSILMHRDAHFGGKFEIMIDYYQQGGKGVCPDFTLEQIYELDLFEKKASQNLAALLLSGSEAEHVQRAKTTYKRLRDLYKNNDEAAQQSKIIADLILSEEEEPQAEIAAILSNKESIVPALIQLIRSEDYYDPLFPGYGQAPLLAIKCLGLIGDRRAMMSLYELIGRTEVFDEECAIFALGIIGDAAKEFLLKILKSKPITEDNERAAIGLIQFKDIPEVAHTCFELLKEPAVRASIPFSTYLVLACEGLISKEDREAFAKLVQDPATPSILHVDIKAVVRGWGKG